MRIQSPLKPVTRNCSQSSACVFESTCMFHGIVKESAVTEARVSAAHTRCVSRQINIHFQPRIPSSRIIKFAAFQLSPIIKGAVPDFIATKESNSHVHTFPCLSDREVWSLFRCYSSKCSRTDKPPVICLLLIVVTNWSCTPSEQARGCLCIKYMLYSSLILRFCLHLWQTSPKKLWGQSDRAMRDTNSVPLLVLVYLPPLPQESDKTYFTSAEVPNAIIQTKINTQLCLRWASCFLLTNTGQYDQSYTSVVTPVYEFHLGNLHSNAFHADRLYDHCSTFTVSSTWCACNTNLHFLLLFCFVNSNHLPHWHLLCSWLEYKVTVWSKISICKSLNLILVIWWLSQHYSFAFGPNQDVHMWQRWWWKWCDGLKMSRLH